MKIYLLLFVSILFSSQAFSTLNQSSWKPGIKSKCGFQKFKCPKANNKCVRKPKKSKCEIVKVLGSKSSKKVIYVDFCEKSGYTCNKKYNGCLDGEYNVSFGEVNPYAGCAK